MPNKTNMLHEHQGEHGGAKGSLPWGRRSPALIAVKTMRATVTSTERTARTSMRALETPPSTSCAYSVAASASTVSGNEYAHHATLNRLIDLLNRAGRETCTGRGIQPDVKTYEHGKGSQNLRSWPSYMDSMNCNVCATQLYLRQI